MNARRTVCVLGFHRSGTSLTTQILRQLGVELGSEQDLMRPQESDNPRGYWEPQWMADLNNELLAALDTTWWRPFPGHDGWHEAAELRPLRERAGVLYEEKLGDASLAGFKDPRTTLTLPFWQQIAPNLHYVICLRNPIDSIASIQRRPEPTLPTRDWGDLWLEYTARALAGTAGKPRVILFYADYFRDPHAQVARVARLLSLSPGDERIRQAAALVKQDLRHHRSSSVELAAAPGIGAPARTLYLALRAAHELRRRSDEEEGAQRLCDAIQRVAVDLWHANRAASEHRRQVREMAVATEHANELAARLRKEVELCRGRLEAIEGSLSWRATAPLRAMRRRAAGRLGSV